MSNRLSCLTCHCMISSQSPVLAPCWVVKTRPLWKCNIQQCIVNIWMTYKKNIMTYISIYFISVRERMLLILDEGGNPVKVVFYTLPWWPWLNLWGNQFWCGMSFLSEWSVLRDIKAGCRIISLWLINRHLFAFVQQGRPCCDWLTLSCAAILTNSLFVRTVLCMHVCMSM